MPTVACPECGRDLAAHEIETNTVTRKDGFETTYRCPYCRSDFESVGEFMEA